ncbi:hypothetical protein PUN28_018881 [Cardiocondyla obscurior]|uniref:Uncharacterized protein n=1 Tax=Cardiocondyla obscurior TaxID=286306 RepID=A0AAW2EEK3_9HYME
MELARIDLRVAVFHSDFIRVFSRIEKARGALSRRGRNTTSCPATPQRVARPFRAARFMADAERRVAKVGERDNQIQPGQRNTIAAQVSAARRRRIRLAPVLISRNLVSDRRANKRVPIFPTRTRTRATGSLRQEFAESFFFFFFFFYSDKTADESRELRRIDG